MNKRIKKRYHSSEIKAKLADIYKDKDGKIPDLSRLERKKKSKIRFFIVGLIIFLIILTSASWAGFFIFKPYQKFSGDRISLSLSAPQKITGGGEVVYKIKYQNQEKEPLGQAEIEARYPSGFVFKSANPKSNNEKNNKWTIGNVQAGQEGLLEIKGQLLGKINSEAVIQAILTYKPGNFNSEFQEIASATTLIDQSPIQLSITGLNKVLPADELEYEVKYKNISSKDLEKIELILLLPKKFILSSADPKANKENKWTINKLEKNKEGKIKIKGIFSKEAGQEEFKIQIGLKGENDLLYLLDEKTITIDVVKDDLSLNLILNGKTDNQTIGFNQPLNFSLAYQNNGTETFYDLEAKIILETTSFNDLSVLDWQTLSDKLNGDITGKQINSNLRQGVITWNKNHLNNFISLEPKKQGTIDFNIDIKDYAELSQWNVSDFRIKSWVEFKIGKIGELKSEKIIKSKALEVLVNSNLELKTGGYYYDENGSTLGSGPLPPLSGQTTTYKIIWKITNNLHEVRNIKVEADLGENASWANESVTNVGDLKYDGSKKIIWTINRLPLGINSAQTSFKISLTPQDKQRGSSAVLLSNPVLSAYDQNTNGQINIVNKSLTTSISDDKWAGGKEIVR